MKKLLSLILSLALLLSLTACGGGNGGNGGGSANSPITSVVHPEFELTNGFIEPVEQMDKTPEGFILQNRLESCRQLHPDGGY